MKFLEFVHRHDEKIIAECEHIIFILLLLLWACVYLLTYVSYAYACRIKSQNHRGDTLDREYPNFCIYSVS